MGDLKPETERKIIAAQDQALQTKYHSINTLQIKTDSKCRMRQQCDETVELISLTCRILAKEQYIKRHGTVCA
jgi:hypothetical protein